MAKENEKSSLNAFPMHWTIDHRNLSEKNNFTPRDFSMQGLESDAEKSKVKCNQVENKNVV